MSQAPGEQTDFFEVISDNLHQGAPCSGGRFRGQSALELKRIIRAATTFSRFRLFARRP